MDFDKSQLMRGTIEGCILQLIAGEPTYGYDIVLQLQQFGFDEVKEGTIYPLLLRLEKKGMVSAEFRQSAMGPARKYYTLTDEGRELLASFYESWQQVSQAVERIMKDGGKEHE